ncbi:transposase IS4 family protein [Alicyclobacillus hesperidum URH17-3-68]|nr:transposase IS4 family protein [Alicyclobacillus hesperidum URH17-3-68]
MHIPGIEKGTVHAYIDAIMLSASALAMHKASRIRQVA